MLKDFMKTGLVQTSKEYDLLMCLGEIEILKHKIEELKGVGDGSFMIRDIRVSVTPTHIIIQRGMYQARIENKLENTPYIYLGYWNAFTFEAPEVFNE